MRGRGAWRHWEKHEGGRVWGVSDIAECLEYRNGPGSRRDGIHFLEEATYGRRPASSHRRHRAKMNRERKAKWIHFWMNWRNIGEQLQDDLEEQRLLPSFSYMFWKSGGGSKEKEHLLCANSAPDILLCTFSFTSSKLYGRCWFCEHRSHVLERWSSWRSQEKQADWARHADHNVCPHEATQWILRPWYFCGARSKAYNRCCDMLSLGFSGTKKGKA